MTVFTTTTRRQRFLGEFESTTGEVLGATLQETLETNPLASSLRAEEFRTALEGQTLPDVGVTEFGFETPRAGPESRVVPAEEARQQISEEGLDIAVPDAGISEDALKLLMQWKSEDRARRDIYDRSAGGLSLGLARLGTALGASAIDPINVAASFIPVVGPTRYAMQLRQAGSTLGRAGIRARTGAVEGAIGATLVEPIVLVNMQTVQGDYDLWDSLLNVAVGSALGGGLHVGAGVAADAVSKGARITDVQPEGATPNIIKDFPADVREQALRASIAQTSTGQRVDVEPIFDIERYSSGQRTLDDLNAELRERAESSFDVQSIMDQVTATRNNQIARPRTLAQWVVDQGGLREFQGEVAAAIGGTRGRPGAISERGLEIDTAARRAWDDGYFPGSPDRPTPAEFLDALEEDVRFGSRFSDQDSAAVEQYQIQEDLKSQLSEFGVSLRDSDKTIREKIAEELQVMGDRMEVTERDFAAMQDARLRSVTQSPVERLRQSYEPQSSRMVDPEIARAGDQQTQNIPLDDDMPTETFEEVMEDIEAIQVAVEDTEALQAEMAALADLDSVAESYGNAVRQAAECTLRRGA